jgi:hypothetical protein
MSIRRHKVCRFSGVPGNNDERPASENAEGQKGGMEEVKVDKVYMYAGGRVARWDKMYAVRAYLQGCLCLYLFHHCVCEGFIELGGYADHSASNQSSRQQTYLLEHLHSQLRCYRSTRNQFVQRIRQGHPNTARNINGVTNSSFTWSIANEIIRYIRGPPIEFIVC